MIRIENISKRFKKLQALDQVSAQLDSGKVISLIGPNGSGKTTLIKCILGMVKPAKGKIYVNEMKINGDPSYREQIGYMPQIGRYPDNMTIGQVFTMLKDIRKDESRGFDEKLLESFGLDKLLNKRMRTLSGGTRQKVSAALAFLFDPQVLILDEPTAGLDPVASEKLKEKILHEKEKGKLILITSHVLSELDELITQVIYMQEGHVLFHKNWGDLQQDTGEQKLSKAIASVMLKN
jgi:Cu-processing system ATP-binding protein